MPSYMTKYQIEGELSISKARINEFSRLENLHGRDSTLGMYYRVLRDKQEKHHDYLMSELLTKEIIKEWKRCKL